MVEPEPPSLEKSVKSRGSISRSKSLDISTLIVSHQSPEPSEDAKHRVQDMLGPWCESDTMNLNEFLQWFSLIGFREELMLTQEQRLLRSCSRRYQIPIHFVDHAKQWFNHFDGNGDGTICYDEFKKVVQKLMKVPSHFELPESRLRYFWSETDHDVSGRIEFEEFLTWWLRHYDPWCPNKEMPFESYYSHIRRLDPSRLDPKVVEKNLSEAPTPITTPQLEERGSEDSCVDHEDESIHSGEEVEKIQSTKRVTFGPVDSHGSMSASMKKGVSALKKGLHNGLVAKIVDVLAQDHIAVGPRVEKAALLSW
jgi:hypothetical protein